MEFVFFTEESIKLLQIFFSLGTNKKRKKNLSRLSIYIGILNNNNISSGFYLKFKIKMKFNLANDNNKNNYEKIQRIM